MNIEPAITISAISLIFSVYSGVYGLKRNRHNDIGKDASQMTTVIVKLENIIKGVGEIKEELNNVQIDLKENRERLIKVEESAKQAHKRLDRIHTG